MIELAGLPVESSDVKALAKDLQDVCHEEYRHLTESNVIASVNLLNLRIGGVKNLAGYLRCIAYN
jgi:hypothetical protein